MNIKFCMVVVCFLSTVLTYTTRSNVIDTAAIYDAFRASKYAVFLAPANCYTLQNTYSIDGKETVNDVYDVKLKDAYLLAKSQKKTVYGLASCIVTLNYEDSTITVLERDTMINYFFSIDYDYRLVLSSLNTEAFPFFIRKQDQDTIVFERMYDEYRTVHRTYRHRIYFDIKTKRIFKIATDIYESYGKNESENSYSREYLISNYTTDCELNISAEKLPIFENANRGLELRQEFSKFRVLNFTRVRIN